MTTIITTPSTAFTKTTTLTLKLKWWIAPIIVQETAHVLEFQRIKLNSGVVSWPDNVVNNFYTTGHNCKLNGVICCADDDSNCQTP